MTVAFTGHRPNKLWDDYLLESKEVNLIEQRIIHDLESWKPDRAIVGMALGIDMLAAYVCAYLSIPYTAAIPCKDQECKWSEKNKAMYRYLLRKAAEVHYVSSEPYNIFSMPNRNHWMVKQLTKPDDRLYAVWDGSKGGTANCINYAKAKQKNITIIDPNDPWINR